MPAATMTSTSSDTAADADARDFVRGSSLLFGGRLISLGINFTVQVLIVRTLSTSDFGSFAFGLAIVAMLSNLNILGLSKAAGRLVPLHMEQQANGLVAGTIVSTVATLLALGLALVLLAHLALGITGDAAIADETSRELLLWMVLLTPIQALDNVGQSLSAVFVGARAIFVRRHLVGPLLKLAAVFIVIITDGSVINLAIWYLVAAAIGLALYLTVLARAWRARNLFAFFRPDRIRWPGRGLYLFAVPLLATDVVIALESNLSIIVLQAFHGPEAVARLQAIVPLAALMFVVVESFKLLFLPVATRLHSRNDTAALADLYWRSVLWLGLLSFPVFVSLVLYAEPITTLLFGDRYAASAPLLIVMACLKYLAGIAGLNYYSLMALGRGGEILTANFIAVLSTLALNLILVPLYGAMGAAIAFPAALVLHNLYQVRGLRGSGIGWRGGTLLRLFAEITAATLALGGLTQAFDLPLWLGLPVIGVTGLLLLRFNREPLALETTFPELARVTPLRLLLGMRKENAPPVGGASFKDR